MINRREFLGTSLTVGAGLALAPELLRAHQSSAGTLMQRAIPSSGELLPVISFGARTVGGAGLSSQPADVAAIKAVLKTFLDNGGKVVDVMHGGSPGEESARTGAEELGIQDKFFWTTGLSSNADTAAVKAQIEAKLATYKVPRIDLVMLPARNAAGDPAYLAALREMKKEGRVRYIGVHDLAPPPYPTDATFARLESIMRKEPIDVVGIDYFAGWRGVEERILPLAQERKIGFMAYFTFDRGRLFQRASTTPLPEWAAEFDARTWAQFFVKYVASHPAVTVVRTGTTNPAHMLENIGAGMGRLPNEAMRKRMAELVDSLSTTPPTGLQPAVVLSAVILDRYVGEYATPAGNLVTFRRDGATLFVKPGTNPEAPLVARSEIRFRDPKGRIFEFHVDAQGQVTGALLEQGGPQPLKLVRK